MQISRSSVWSKFWVFTESSEYKCCREDLTPHSPSFQALWAMRIIEELLFSIFSSDSSLGYESPLFTQGACWGELGKPVHHVKILTGVWDCAGDLVEAWVPKLDIWISWHLFLQLLYSFAEESPVWNSSIAVVASRCYNWVWLSLFPYPVH